MKRFLLVLFLFPSICFGTFTEFYCQSGGSNLNAGSTTSNSATYTSTSGNWVQSTRVFTPTDGVNPSLTVSVGMWASVYLNAATVGVYIGRVSAVQNATNGTITIDSTAIAGSAPANSTGGMTIKVGGAWKGPNAGSAYPFLLGSLNALKDASDHIPRINLKNDATYSITAGITVFGQTMFVQGYSASPGDQGKAIIDSGTSTINPISTNNGQTTLADIIVQSTATTGTADGFTTTGGNQLIRCVAHGMRGNGFNIGSSNFVKECEAYDNNKSNTSGNGGFKFSSSTTFENCVSHDNTGSNTDGFAGIISATPVTFTNCIADTNGRHGFSIQSNTNPYASFYQCDAYNNGTDGIKNLLTTANSFANIKNCNFIKNGGYGINSALTTGHWFGSIENCGFGSGTAQNTSGTTNNTDDLEISGSVTYPSNLLPWVDAPNGDFRINLTEANWAGRGAFTETAASYSGTVGFPDIGAAQSKTGPGGTFSKESSAGYAQ